MGLSQKELQTIDRWIETTDLGIEDNVMRARLVALVAAQTKLMNFMVNELGSIGSAIERIAGRMP